MGLEFRLEQTYIPLDRVEMRQVFSPCTTEEAPKVEFTADLSQIITDPLLLNLVKSMHQNGALVTDREIADLAQQSGKGEITEIDVALARRELGIAPVEPK